MRGDHGGDFRGIGDDQFDADAIAFAHGVDHLVNFFGRRPVSMVKTRTLEEMREAMSMTTMPSFWKLVEMAMLSPNSESAQARTSSAVAASNCWYCTNLYQDTGECPGMQGS